MKWLEGKESIDQNKKSWQFWDCYTKNNAKTLGFSLREKWATLGQMYMDDPVVFARLGPHPVMI